MYRLLFARVQLHVFRKSLICIRPLYRLEYFAVALLGVRTRRCLIGFLHGAAFQWVNPKSWIVAISAVSSFSFMSDNQLVNGLILSAVFVVISQPCVGTWMIAGGSIRGILNTPTRIAWFNRIMVLLLVGSVIQAIFV